MRDYAELVKALQIFNVNYDSNKLTNDAADAIEGLLAAVPHWISVEERLPEKESRVLFDSQREAHRWDELVLLQRAGKISDLERQVRYRLIPAQYGPDGRQIEKPCDYIADFVYRQDGRVVVEDAKGRRTDAYIIKRKLMLRMFGIRVVEV